VAATVIVAVCPLMMVWLAGCVVIDGAKVTVNGVVMIVVPDPSVTVEVTVSATALE
jgi:hypothetical protein